MKPTLVLILLCLLLGFNSLAQGESRLEVDWQQIYEQSQKVIESAPEDILANFQYSIALANLGKVEEAYDHLQILADKISLRDFNQILEPLLIPLETKEEPDLLLYNYAAFHASLNKRYQNSIHYFQKIIALDPENVWIRNYLAAAYIELERYQEGKQALQQALEIKDNEYSHFLLAYINYKEGKIFKSLIEMGRSGNLLKKFVF